MKDETPPPETIIRELFDVIASRREGDPEVSYTARLLQGDPDRLLQKIGEEATEVVIAGKNEARKALTGEIADLWFHTLVLMVAKGISPEAVFDELHQRRYPRQSG